MFAHKCKKRRNKQIKRVNSTWAYNQPTEKQSGHYVQVIPPPLTFLCT